MCLQWCHVRGWLIDNDLACVGCPLGVLAPSAPSCETCAHHQVDAGGAEVCALTHTALPHRRSCCHHNAAPAAETHIPLELIPIAPWVTARWGDDPEALLATHHSAPGVAFDDEERPALVLADLATPLVSGILSAQWPAAVYVGGFVAELAKYLKLDVTQVSRTYLRRYRQFIQEQAAR